MYICCVETFNPNDPMAYAAASATPAPPPHGWADVLGGLWQELELRATPLINTPWADLNAATGGLRGLGILGARPGAGKSALAAQLSAASAIGGVPALYISTEMHTWAVLERVLRSQGPAHQPATLPMLQAVAAAVKSLLGDRLHIFQPSPGDLSAQINAAVDDVVAFHVDKPVWVVLDSLHGLAHGLAGGVDERAALIAAVEWARHIADRDEVGGVLALAHLNRESMKAGDADTTSFLGSSAIEYYADFTLVMKQYWNGRELEVLKHYRPTQPPPKDPARSPVRTLELHLNKNRYGRTLEVEAVYFADCNQFAPPTHAPAVGDRVYRLADAAKAYAAAADAAPPPPRRGKGKGKGDEVEFNEAPF